MCRPYDNISFAQLLCKLENILRFRVFCWFFARIFSNSTLGYPNHVSQFFFSKTLCQSSARLFRESGSRNSNKQVNSKSCCWNYAELLAAWILLPPPLLCTTIMGIPFNKKLRQKSGKTLESGSRSFLLLRVLLFYSSLACAERESNQKPNTWLIRVCEGDTVIFKRISPLLKFPFIYFAPK